MRRLRTNGSREISLPASVIDGSHDDDELAQPARVFNLPIKRFVADESMSEGGQRIRSAVDRTHRGPGITSIVGGLPGLGALHAPSQG
jgi:hypothetical protein